MTTILKDNEVNLIPNSKKKILTGGCFDLLHDGHIEFLKKSKNLGESLIVLLESDERIKDMKGEKRPINSQEVRAENLKKLAIADFVILLSNRSDNEYYYNMTKSIQPDIIALTKGDPLRKTKEDQAKMVGGKIQEVMERNHDYSTTDIINNYE